MHGLQLLLVQFIYNGLEYFAALHKVLEAVKSGAPMPIDVYDGATWQAVSVLSERSISEGGAPQQMPDFTGGEWMKRPRLDVCEM